jgi:hypothetical protein
MVTAAPGVTELPPVARHPEQPPIERVEFGWFATNQRPDPRHH